MTTNRRIAAIEIIAMVFASLGAVTGGNAWLLFATIPIALIGVWMFVRSCPNSRNRDARP